MQIKVENIFYTIINSQISRLLQYITPNFFSFQKKKESENSGVDYFSTYNAVIQSL